MLRSIIAIFTISFMTATITQAQTVAFSPSDANDVSLVSKSNNVETIIFFTNPEQSIYYADFEAVKSKVTSISLFKDDELVIQESALLMPENTIYEINLMKLKPGTYNIELTTVNDDSFIKEFDVKSSPKSTVNNH